MRIYGVTGWKNAGKTTLVERLVADFTARGLVIATVKHAHHAAEVDHPGRDSHRHRMAGARQVILATPVRWALVTELRGAEPPPLEALLARLDPCDLVLVEGWKAEGHPKVEVHRVATGHDLMAPGNPTIRAVACDRPLTGLAVPVLHLDDASAVADFILKDLR
jgi:molybdopterin-guanine dinucleotide biosynthesis protein MobB